MKKLTLAAFLAASVLQGESSAWHECPPIPECHPHPNDVDALACPVLVGMAGSYGAVTVTAEGDVLVNGELFWDCPPYQVGEERQG